MVLTDRNMLVENRMQVQGAIKYLVYSAGIERPSESGTRALSRLSGCVTHSW
jgi:hypothetical protein